MSTLKITFLTLFLFVLGSTVLCKSYADKSYYLIDSLDVSTLNEIDKNLIDSLLGEYHHEKEDSLKLNILGVLISLCEDDVWIKYNQLLKDKAAELSLKNKGVKVYVKQLSSAFNNDGFYYYGKNEIDKAIVNFEKSIQLSQQINNIEVIPTALNNLGYIHKQQGNVLKALAYYHQSLKLNKTLNAQEEIALSLNNIGSIYYYLKEYGKALKYYQDALKIEVKVGGKKAIARLKSNIGAVYQKQKKYHLALTYYKKAIKDFNETSYVRGATLCLSKYAAIELELLTDNNPKPLQLILEKFKKNYLTFKNLEDFEGMANSAYNISTAYLRLNNILLAEKYGKESLTLSQKIGFPESIKSAAKVLQEIATLKNDYKRAYAMQLLFYKMQDSIANEVIKEAVIQKEYQYQYEKKMITDSLQNAEKIKLNKVRFNQKIKAQKLYTYIGVIGTVLLLIVVLVIYRGYQIKRKNNVQLANKNIVIEEKNIQITESILYAKRIQQAIFPLDSELKSALKKHFVFYLPKDIVAGDFYWMQKKEDTVLFAAADCTGHGVPGAILSVMCNNALNKSVKEHGLQQPSEILDKTSKLVAETLQHNKDGQAIVDGMDIALCAINFKTKQLQYAGANNPLFIVRDGDLKIIKPNKCSIGYSDKEQRYVNHSIDLKTNDCIYIFSDGFADQFGGDKDKKYGLKRFRNLLLSINELTMDKQRKKVKQAFYAWKGETFQLDDICIIGVRI